MATVELIPATDQDGSELWQHEECSGVQPANRVAHPDSMGEGTPDTEHPCPMCGEPGLWLPLYRPAGRAEINKIEHREQRRDRAVRRAQLALAEALT